MVGLAGDGTNKEENPEVYIHLSVPARKDGQAELTDALLGEKEWK